MGAARALCLKPHSGTACPAWGLAQVTVAVKEPGAGDWQLVFLDDTDEDRALGYHKDSNTGMPVMEVFVRTCRQAGVSESASASHELAEALADPYLTTASFDGRSKFWAVEIGDAAQSSNYEVNGVEMHQAVRGTQRRLLPISRPP